VGEVLPRRKAAGEKYVASKAEKPKSKRRLDEPECKNWGGNLPFIFMKKLGKKENQWLSMNLDIINPMYGEMWRRFEPMTFDEDAESIELEIHNNNFRLVANPYVWKKYNRTKKLFVICHEMCHVSFGHWLINPKLDREWCNIAQDIQVNEFLTRWYFRNEKLGKDLLQ
jgi:hypothetical protein